MSDKLMKAYREYHWLRIKMFDKMTADERQVIRKSLIEAERKLHDVRQETSTPTPPVYYG